jgi:hypothetical protein
MDIVVVQVRDAGFDGGADNDFIVAAITGVPYDPAAPPPDVVPPTPPNALALVQVGIGGGSAAINPAYVAAVSIPLSGESGIWTPNWTAGGGGPGSVLIGSGVLQGRWTVLGDRCFIDLFLSFAGDTSGGNGPWEFDVPFMAGQSAPDETNLFSKSYTGAGTTLAGEAIVPRGTRRLVPYAPYSNSNTRMYQVQNCNASGTPGTGIPSLANDYAFKAGSNFAISGSYVIA